MYILTSTYGVVIIVKPLTEQDAEKFLSVRGARWISEDTKKANEGNLTDTALTHDDAIKVNRFVGECECWQFKNTKKIRGE